MDLPVVDVRALLDYRAASARRQIERGIVGILVGPSVDVRLRSNLFSRQAATSSTTHECDLTEVHKCSARTHFLEIWRSLKAFGPDVAYFNVIRAIALNQMRLKDTVEAAGADCYITVSNSTRLGVFDFARSSEASLHPLMRL